MHFPLDSTRALKGDNDRQVAMQAMVEGQATYEQLSIMVGGSDMGLALPGGWDNVREMIRSGQASMPKFASAPTLLQETLLFPYIAGSEFIRQYKRARPGRNPQSGQPIEITARRVVKFVPSQVLKADLNDGYVAEDELSAEDEDAGHVAPESDDDDSED